MCNSSERLMKCRARMAAIFALVAAVLCLIISISSYFTPLLIFAQMHIDFLVSFLIYFVILVASGIVGCIGVARMKHSCLFAMFIMNLLTFAMISSFSQLITPLYELYSPIEHQSTCANRYERVQQLVNMGSSTFTAGLCSPTCLCDFTRDSSTVLSSSISSNGIKKIQDCTTLWRSQFDAAAGVLAQMETMYDCTGFCQTPTQNRFSFTDINKQNLEVQCAPRFRVYATQYIDAAYNWTSFTGLICLVAVILQLFNFCSRMKESQLKSQTVVVPANETEQELRPY